MALMLGVANGLDVQDWCRAIKQTGRQGREFVGFVEATIRLLQSVSGIRTPVAPEISEDDELYLTAAAAGLLPKFLEPPSRLHFDRIRFLWRTVCVATDAYLSNPASATDPWVVFGCQWRRLCYRFAPEQTIFALAVVSDALWSTLGLPEISQFATGDADTSMPDVASR